MAAYPHEIAIYSDELRYLDIARSLRDGRGLVVRNMPSDYQKILYSLFLLPALALPTTALQIQAAGWLNAVYAASAVFPAYAILRRMEVSASRRRFLMAAVALCPTMVVTVSFMSENVSSAFAVADLPDAARLYRPQRPRPRWLVRGVRRICLPALPE